jgi:hypothetical protein
MSNRGKLEGLWGAAVIIWGIAVLLGVFVAAPLWLGFDVDVGLIVSALAALGAFAAAAAAVWVATTDRRDRKQERDAEDEAQARMVLVVPRRPTNPLELQIQVTNHGSRVIMDLKFVGLAVEGNDFGDLQPTVGPFPVIAPPAASSAHAGSLAWCSPRSMPFTPSATAAARSANTTPGAYTHGPLYVSANAAVTCADNPVSSANSRNKPIPACDTTP